MTPLLQQFLSEARDFLQSIGEKLLQLEDRPGDAELITELFRLVHTLKGNSGLFDFPELSGVLHAAEDLMDAVRDGRIAFARGLADQLLETMDFVAILIEEIESNGVYATARRQEAQRLTQSLRNAVSREETAEPEPPAADAAETAAPTEPRSRALAGTPEPERMALYRRLAAGERLTWAAYRPEEECFFKGEDPLYQLIQAPDCCWRAVSAREAWPAIAELDAYRCILDFELITTRGEAELLEHFRYTQDQLELAALRPWDLMEPVGERVEGPALADFVQAARERLAAGDREGLECAARTLLELTASDQRVASILRWLLLALELEPASVETHARLIETLAADAGETLASHAAAPETGAAGPPEDPDRVAVQRELWEVQREILALPDAPDWLPGRLRAVTASLAGLVTSLGREELLPGLDAASEQALASADAAPLHHWMETAWPEWGPAPGLTSGGPAPTALTTPPSDDEPKFGRRAEDALPGPRILKVDQGKVDRLMGLIGEMVVAKNALPYLAARAETQFGAREMSREIKAQYAVINRIAEDMQDAIMQVRMTPISFVFQRFPRLVRDLTRKMGKEVKLVMEGEDTEADKHIIECLTDPMIHIVRNSLDHGLETPEERRGAGKPPTGKLTIRAVQESDRVRIEIADDGRGIDPEHIRRKARERGLIDESRLERLSDQEAIDLVFAAGFSTAEQVTDLSGRGVGMDVVRSAIAKVKGTIDLKSQPGVGTRLRLSLPLSMAVTNVMIIRSHGQQFGVPMDDVIETVRVDSAAIRTIKRHRTAVLRSRIVPLVPLNELLGLPDPPRPNGDGAYATLVVRIGKEPIGIMVDDFRETVDIILKPMAGILDGIKGYAGSALMGDGSVLLVLDPKDLLS